MSDKFIWGVYLIGWGLFLFGVIYLVLIAIVESPAMGAMVSTGVGFFLIYSLQYKDGRTPRDNPWKNP